MVVGEFTHETDLLVIGGGPGGYTAAFRAASRGIATTILESTAALGGVCLHCGCIPSKTLLHIAELVRLPEHAAEMGVVFAPATLELDKVNAWKSRVIDKLTRGLAATAKRLKVEVLRGTGRFEDGRTVAVTDGEVPRIRFKRALIAAGSRPVTLRDIQIESPNVLDSTSALGLERIPPSLLVVGGGYIGLELGSVFAALGSEVTVVEMLPTLLAGGDEDLVRPLVKRLNKTFREVCLETRVTGMKEVADGLEVAFAGPNPPQRKTFAQVLVSVGRRPNSDLLGLDHTGVQVNERGFIKVDAQMRTTDPRIFAIGDIVGEPMLAHKAMAEAKVVADVLAGGKAVFEPRGIPAVVFTDPEIAWVGLTESQARKDGIAVEVRKLQWPASGRASAIGRTDGLTKIICAADTRRVLGVGLVGPFAGEMISEAALALEMGAVAEDLAATIHPHPTISELLGDVADMAAGPGGGPAH